VVGVAKYKVAEVRLEGDQVGIILSGKVKFDDGTEQDDGFAVWIPADEYKNMTIDQIKERLKQEVKERIKFLKRLKKEKEEKEKKYKEAIEMTSELVKALEIEDTEEGGDGEGGESTE